MCNEGRGYSVVSVSFVGKTLSTIGLFWCSCQHLLTMNVKILLDSHCPPIAVFNVMLLSQYLDHGELVVSFEIESFESSPSFVLFLFSFFDYSGSGPCTC